MRVPFLRKKLTAFQIIIIGFLGVILIGTLLLMLPAASKSAGSAPFGDALFTATSAVCVTGLAIRDTASYWTGFGQGVILLLIQIGGLGVISVAALIALISGRKISLLQRGMLEDTFSAHQIGGVVRLTGFLFRVSFTVELAGAALMMPVFCRHFGVSGIWMSLFHSVSAFCNAGFDVMGEKTGGFSSLASFRGSYWITAVICAMIIIGGIGFLTWDDISSKKFHLRKYRMQSKVVLTATAFLILIPAAFLFFGEFPDLPFRERFCLSLFQAVTPRTAGFTTANLSAMSGASRALIVVLMLIGGSPGSTAGGIKTTTAAVLVANAHSVFRRNKSAQLFGRRISDDVIKSAATLLMMYLSLALLGAAVISAAEQLSMGDCFFETVSAIGTVGLSCGITPSLGSLSRLILIGLMFFGRVGGLTLIYATVSRNSSQVPVCPGEKIAVG